MKHENIDNARVSILEKVNIGALIEGIAPLTMQGSSIKKTLSESFEAGKLGSLLAVSTTIYETQTVQNVDEQIKKFAYEASTALNESGIKGSLVYAFECIERSNTTGITESALKTIDELVAVSEDAAKASIRAGKLNPFKSLPFIKNIIESANVIAENGTIDTATVTVSNPVSYFESKDSGVYFRSGNKVFCVNESSVRETSSPSNKFTYVSGIVEALTCDENNFYFEHEVLGSFKIDENGISRKDSEGVFENISLDKFSSRMSLLIESHTYAPGIAGRTLVAEHTSAADALVAISENYANIAKLDIVFEAFNKTTNETALFVNNGDNFHVVVVESVKQPKIVESFTDIREAVKAFNKKIGFDLTETLSKEIAETVAADDAKAKEIKERQEIIEELSTREADLTVLVTEMKDDEDESEEDVNEMQDTLTAVSESLNEQKEILNGLLR